MLARGCARSATLWRSGRCTEPTASAESERRCEPAAAHLRGAQIHAQLPLSMSNMHPMVKTTSISRNVEEVRRSVCAPAAAAVGGHATGVSGVVSGVRVSMTRAIWLAVACFAVALASECSEGSCHDTNQFIDPQFDSPGLREMVAWLMRHGGSMRGFVPWPRVARRVADCATSIQIGRSPLGNMSGIIAARALRDGETVLEVPVHLTLYASGPHLQPATDAVRAPTPRPHRARTAPATEPRAAQIIGEYRRRFVGPNTGTVYNLDMEVMPGADSARARRQPPRAAGPGRLHGAQAGVCAWIALRGVGAGQA
jgi:hypothetical protein